MKKILLSSALCLISSFTFATSNTFMMKIDHYNSEDPFLSHDCSSQLQAQISYDIGKDPISLAINGNYNLQKGIGSFQADGVVNSNNTAINPVMHPLGDSTSYDFANFNYHVITINAHKYILAGVLFDIANKNIPEDAWGKLGKISFILLDNTTSGACVISSTPSPTPIIN